MNEQKASPHYTWAEKVILSLLASGEVVKYEQIGEAMYIDRDTMPTSNVAQVLISRIRRKLGTGQIQTIRGVGYRLVMP